MSRDADSATAMIRLALDEAEAAVEVAADAREAWAIAAAVGTAVDEARSRAARLRANAAARVQRQDSLSLRGLADRIGVAPSRAERLIKAARATTGATDE